MTHFSEAYVAPSGPRVAEIRRAVCAHFELSEAEIRSSTRERRIAQPRQVAMHLARRMTSRSLQEIAMQFGLMNHATVLHADRRIHMLRQTDPDLAWSVREIEAALRGGAA